MAFPDAGEILEFLRRLPGKKGSIEPAVVDRVHRDLIRIREQLKLPDRQETGRALLRKAVASPNLPMRTRSATARLLAELEGGDLAQKAVLNQFALNTAPFAGWPRRPLPSGASARWLHIAPALSRLLEAMLGRHPSREQLSRFIDLVAPGLTGERPSRGTVLRNWRRRDQGK